MATESGGTNHPLSIQLFEEPYRFDFFQAVRLLERIFKNRQPVGRDINPAREVARFRTLVSLNFPPSQIHQMRRGEDHQPPSMLVAFMGLTGPVGLLPNPYTELLIERVRYKDTALWDFFDIFNHRAISLFFRAWEKYRFPIGYERGEADAFTDHLFNLIGLGTPGLRDRFSFPDEGLLLYGGLIAQQPHSSVSMAAILADFFGVEAQIEQFTGQWIKLDDESKSFLGRANSQLGVNTIAGEKIWDTQSKFRVKLGPLKLKDFVEFLPVNSAFKPATEIVRFMCGLEFDFDVQLVLEKAEVPSCIMTTRARRRPMLGWTTWLKTESFDEDDSQVVLSVKN
ncbi:MAG: type VI secretion system baseplate subunit TssG [Acidobacteriota bacterium]